MPSVVLTPGAVDAGVLSGSSLPPVVGSPPQWNDSSDTTYATVVNDVRGTQYPFAPFAPLSVSGTPISYDWQARVSCALGSPLPFTVFVKSADGFTSVESPSITPTATPQWYSGTIVLPFPDFVLDRLSTGDLRVYVEQTANNSGAHQDTIAYEVRVTLNYLTTGTPPLRRYPPVNNGGFGPTRHWPRTVNRRAGGTY